MAAAISALFAVQLEKAGFADAGLLVPLTFFVIIATVVLQSTTARPLARWLKVAEPEPSGFLIIGANIVARTIAKALVQNGLNVLLADTGWDKIAKAKSEGLRAYFGNPISEHADRHLDLIGIGRVLALSPHENVNTAAVMHFRMEVGRNNVFMIQSKSKQKVSQRSRMSAQRQGKLLFGSKITYTDLAAVLERGGKIRTTKLSEEFEFEAFVAKHRHQAIPLFAISPRGKFHVFCEEQPLEPKPGWSIVYLHGDEADNLKPVNKKKGDNKNS